MSAWTLDHTLIPQLLYVVFDVIIPVNNWDIFVVGFWDALLVFGSPVGNPEICTVFGGMLHDLYATAWNVVHPSDLIYLLTIGGIMLNPFVYRVHP